MKAITRRIGSQRKRDMLSPEVYLTIIAYLVASWVFILGKMRRAYVDNPAAGNIVPLSILHYVLFLVVLAMLFLLFLETRLSHVRNGRLRDIRDGLHRIVSTKWLYVFIYTVISLALSSMELRDTVLGNAMTTSAEIILTVALYLVLIKGQNREGLRKTGKWRTSRWWLFPACIVPLYYVYVFTCSVIFTDISVENKSSRTPAKELNLEITEQGYFLRADVKKVLINNFINVQFDRSNTRNGCLVDLDGSILNLGTLFLTVTYTRPPFNIVSEKTVFIETTVRTKSQ